MPKTTLYGLNGLANGRSPTQASNQIVTCNTMSSRVVSDSRCIGRVSATTRLADPEISQKDSKRIGLTQKR